VKEEEKRRQKKMRGKEENRVSRLGKCGEEERKRREKEEEEEGRRREREKEEEEEKTSPPLRRNPPNWIQHKSPHKNSQVPAPNPQKCVYEYRFKRLFYHIFVLLYE
jgi:ATPase subunit of ABC transporter with duplicated ATPase domains